MAGWVHRLAGAVAAAALVAAAAAEEAEEGAVDPADLGVAVMLLGSVTFMMGLFYLTHLHDLDLRHYSWYVISSTISIFCAVLLFQAVDGVIDHYVLEDASAGKELLVNMAHMLLWYASLQILLAYISGALGEEPTDKRQVTEQIKCWATLLGHITGFAAINAFATLQQQVPRTWSATASVGFMAWILLYLFNNITHHVRKSISLADDGVVDEWEKLWDEGTEETEDDVVGLAVAFNLVQWLRFTISGILPNTEGEESETEICSHPGSQAMTLLFTGVLFIFIEGFRLKYIPFKLPRLTPQLQNIVSMCFAWCVMFSSDWLLSAHAFKMEGAMIKHVLLALLVTTFALLLIFCLDKLDDLAGAGSEIDKIIRSVVMALGILIGFSWEKAFDVAVSSISATIPVLPMPATKLGMAIMIVTLVLPAWRMYILPTVLDFQEEDEARQEELEQEEGLGEALEGRPREEEEEAAAALGLAEPLLDARAAAQLEDGAAEGRRGSKGSERRASKGGERRGSKGQAAAAAARAEEPERGRAALLRQQAGLESRNAELEASLRRMVAELDQLRKLVDLLDASSPRSQPKAAWALGELRAAAGDDAKGPAFARPLAAVAAR